MNADEAFCQRARKVYPAGFMLTLLHHDVTVFQAGLTLECKMEPHTAFCAVVESFVLTFPFSYAHARPPALIVLRLLYIVFCFFPFGNLLCSHSLLANYRTIMYNMYIPLITFR